MRRKTFLAAALLGWLLPVPVLSSPAAFAQLVADLDTLRNAHAVPGFALTVVSTGNGVQAGAGGMADRDSGRPVTPDTLFRIGSITKTFNALAILRLVERGRLDLNAPLRKIVPDAPLVNPWADRHPVRVVHLLEHTSGLLDLTRDEFDHNRPFTTLEAAFAWRPQARVVQWQPGLHAVYSNANAGLAGLVIERAGGEDYAHFMTARVLWPLGMRSATLSDDAVTRRRLATGYDTDGVTPIPYWHMIFPPLGAINATPREMAALVELFLRRGQVGEKRLLDAASIARMEHPATTLAARYGLTYGNGPGLEQWLHQGFLWYGHGGDGDGYLSVFAYNRDTDAGYFLTINAFKHDAMAAMQARVQAYLTRGVAAPPPPAAMNDPVTLHKLTGTYEEVTRRFPWQVSPPANAERLQVVLQDGGLYTRSSRGQRQLIPVTAHGFRREGQPLATIAIVPQDGELYMQADFGNYRRVGETP